MKFFQRIEIPLRRATSIVGGTDFQGTIEVIRGNVALRRTNVWMLFCSALIACIGLDTDSTAVIIGAMLISPLMSPILGVGMAVGIQEKNLLASSLKNLLLATVISLGTSFIYFTISPLSQPTGELTARITPTILDVGIAFFGGVAGIVAGSRKEKTNAIPGVAIATALMPPVCTAGFGLATHRTEYFLGAFYLYFINAVFIAFATYIIALWLGFPRYIRKQTDADTHIKASIVIFAILVIIPSGIIFKNVLAKLRFDQNVKSFVNTELRQDLRQPLEWSVVNNKDGTRELKVFLVGKKVDDAEKQTLEKTLSDKYSLGNLSLDLIQLNLSPEEITKATSAVETNLSDKLSFVQSIEESQKEELENLKTEIEVLKENTDRANNSLPDLLKALFPSVAEAQIKAPDNFSEGNVKKSVLVTFQKDASPELKKEVLAKIERISKLKLNDKNIAVEEINPNEKPIGQPPNSNSNTKN